jgi:glycosyltransferase involved in cell wall biosynthesis
LRILWQSVAPWHMTGYGNETATICKILQELGHEVIISAYYGLMDGGFIRWRGIPVHPADKAWGVEKTKAYVDKFKCDIAITFQDIWTFPPGFGSDFPWYPYFPVDHEPIPPLVKERLAFARKPICYSKSAVKELQKANINSYYVPHSFDMEVYKPNKTDTLHFDDGKFVIGCVGTNRGLRKNLSGLLEAFATFHKKHTDSTLYVHTNPAGHSLGDLNLTLLANELGIMDSVIFPSKDDYGSGAFTEEWMAKMYNSLDVFLLPSRGEGFGMPIIEAQACGVPVIISNCTSMPELFGSGWLLKDLKKEWTYQSSYQFIPSEDCILYALEEAYMLWKAGVLTELSTKARDKALEYSRNNVKTLWKDTLDDIEKHLHDPLNREGIQKPRLLLIPKSVEPKKVLDMGSGLNTPYKTYLEPLGEYLAIDNRGNDNGVKNVDITRTLPFTDKSFGFVWCSEVLEHIEPRLQSTVVLEAKRVGVHGVVIFPTEDNGNFSKDPDHEPINYKELDKYVNITKDCYGNGVILW